MSVADTIKKIEKLKETDRVLINPEYKYQADEWGMNRNLVIISEASLSVEDLKAIVSELK